MQEDNPSFQATMLELYFLSGLPTGAYVSYGGAVQGGFGIEYGSQFERGLAFNFITGEMSRVRSSGKFGYLGTPTMLSGSGGGNAGFIYGATSNRALEGIDVYGEIDLGVDLVGQASLSGSMSRSLPGNTTLSEWLNEGDFNNFAIDPMSGNIIETRGISLQIGANLYPNAVDFGLTGGYSVSEVDDWINLYELFGWR